MSDFRADLLQRPAGQQIEREHRAAARGDFIAQQRRRRVDQAAFDTAGGRDELPFLLEVAAPAVLEPKRDRLERLPREPAGKVLAPALPLAGPHIETAVRRRKRRDANAARFQQRRPGAIRSQTRPACAAEREHDGPRLHRDRAA